MLKRGVAKTKNAPKSQKVGKLPSKQEILDFLQGASVQAGKREIARAFGVKGGDRVALKELLRDMADDGLIAGSRRKLQRPGVLPSVTVLEIVERDSYGDFIARPDRILIRTPTTTSKRSPITCIGRATRVLTPAMRDRVRQAAVTRTPAC